MAHRVVVRVHIDAPIERVWRALCEPSEVEAWDGAQPRVVPTGYPQPGQHAQWRVHVARVPVTLHDRVDCVDAPIRLAARITYGYIDLAEEYRLERDGDTTTITSDNVVRSRPPGFGWLAARATRRAVTAALTRLAAHCAS
jgi:uncharacterized protein YndB with AHSA1/START domain